MQREKMEEKESQKRQEVARQLSLLSLGFRQVEVVVCRVVGN